MPEHPQLTPLDLEELYSNVVLGNPDPHPVPKGMAHHPAEETHFRLLVLRCHYFSHHQR